MGRRSSRIARVCRLLTASLVFALPVVPAEALPVAPVEATPTTPVKSAPVKPAPRASTVPGALPCRDTIYTQSAPGTSYTYAYTPATGTIPQVPKSGYGAYDFFSGSSGYDALAYSALTGKVYAVENKQALTELLEIDPSGLQAVKKIPLTPVASRPTRDRGLAATLDGTQLAVWSRYGLDAYLINIDPAKGPVGRVDKAVNFGDAPDNVYDWAYNPVDGFLYAVNIYEQLIRFNWDTGTAELSPPNLVPDGTHTGAFFDAAGNYYDVNNQNPGKFNRLDLTGSSPGAPTPLSEVVPATLANTGPAGSVFGDMGGCLQTYDHGTAPASYGTDTATAKILPGVGLGKTTNAWPTDKAGDALTSAPTLAIGATTLSHTAAVTNNIARPVTLAGWIDLNRNGTFDSPAERTTTTVPPGATSATLTWNPPGGVPGPPGDTWLRLRLYGADTADPQSTGPYDGAGAVEDHKLTVLPEADIPHGGEPCSTKPFLSNPQTVLRTYNPDGSTTAVGPAVTPGYDAVGFSHTTGYLYAISTDYKLLRINPNTGAVEDRRDIALTKKTVPYTAGAVTPDGSFLKAYSAADAGSVKAPVDTIDIRFGPDYGKVVATIGTDPGALGDLAVHPKDGRTYGVFPGNSRVWVINPDGTGVIYPGPIFGAERNLGAGLGVAFDSVGNLNIYAANGFSYQLDLSDSTAAAPLGAAAIGAKRANLISQIRDAATVNDAAGCGPVLDYGDLAGFNTPTTTAKLAEGLSLGKRISPEPAPRRPSLNSATSLGTINGLGDTYDDGVSSMPSLVMDMNRYQVNPSVTNTTGKPVTLAAWIDFNADNTFAADERQTVTVAPGATEAAVSWSGPQIIQQSGKIVSARFRLYDKVLGTGDIRPDGPYDGGGEVEDYTLIVQQNVCQPEVYLSTGIGDNGSKIYSYDVADQKLTEDTRASFPLGFDGIGLSPLNGHVYGMRREGNRGAVVVDYDPKTGAVNETPLDPALPSSIRWDVGAVSPDGRSLWLMTSKDQNVQKINIDPTSTDPGKVEALWKPAEMPYDWAFHPRDGHLYGVLGTGELVRFDPDDGAVEKTAAGFVPGTAEYRGVFFDADGNLYALDQSSPSKVFQIDLTQSTETTLLPMASVAAPRQSLTVALPDTVADAGGCLKVADYGDAPETYKTVRGSGPDHNIDRRLLLGDRVSSEPDARRAGILPILDGTGDTFDDALTTPPVLRVGANRAYTVTVKVKNETGEPVTLAGWIDRNADGDFDDPDERQTRTVADGATAAYITWPELDVPAALSGRKTYARFRLYDKVLPDAEVLPAGGHLGTGEVEDYPVEIQQTDLAVTEAIPPQPLEPGATGDLDIKVTNRGPANTSEPTTITITLPPGVTSEDTLGGRCVPNATHTTLTCTYPGAIRAGSGIDFRLAVKVGSALATGLTLSGGSVTVTGPRDVTPANNSKPFELKTTATRSSDLGVAVAVPPDKPRPGSTVPVTLTVTNAGPSDTLTDSTVQVTLPEHTEVTTPPPGCQVNGRQLTCTAGPLTAGQNTTIPLVLQVLPAAPLDTDLTGGTVTVTGTTTDPNPADNTKPIALRTSLTGLSDLKIESPETAPAAPGTVTTVGVRVTNLGPSTTTEAAVVRVTLPAGVTLSGPPPADCTADLVCTIAAGMLSGGGHSFNIAVLVAPDAAPDTVLTGGTAAVTLTDDTVPDNNEAAVTVRTAPAQTDLTVTATPPAAPVVPGTESTMAFTVTNRGPSNAAPDTVVTVTLPEHVEVTVPPAGCAVVGRTLTCTVSETLTVGGTKAFDVPFKVAAAAPGNSALPGTAAVTGTGQDPVAADNTAPFQVPTGPATADLKVTPVDAGTVQPGGAAPVTLTVSNAGPSDTRTPSVLTVTAPAGTAFLTYPPQCAATATGLRCTVGPLAAGVTAELPVTLTVGPEAPLGTALSGEMTFVNSDVTDAQTPNRVALTVTTPAVGLSDLWVQVPDPAHVSPGAEVPIRVSVLNLGPSPTGEFATLTVTLPDKTTLAREVPGCAAAGRVLTCRVDENTARLRGAVFVIPVKIDADAAPGVALTGGQASVVFAVTPANDPDRTNNSVAFAVTPGAAETDLGVAVAGRPRSFHAARTPR